MAVASAVAGVEAAWSRRRYCARLARFAEYRWAGELWLSLCMFETFTQEARDVCTQANYEVQNRSHLFIGAEHLLLATIRKECQAAKQLRQLGVNINRLATAIEVYLDGPSDEGYKVRPDEHRQSSDPITVRISRHAITEDHRSTPPSVGSVDLIIGLLLCKATTAAKMLTKEGVTVERVRFCKESS